jgi:MFS transporter, SP family, general alpha glucoside:H+ symporter
MWGFVLPYLFNPNEADLGAKTTFIFAGFCFVSAIYLWFYQPETAGRSFEELDELFINRIPAWQFAGYRTNAQINAEEAGVK